MAISHRRETGRFLARGDDGREYWVIKVTEFLNSPQMHPDIRSTVAGRDMYWIVPSTEVFHVGGEFIVSSTGVKLTPL